VRWEGGVGRREEERGEMEREANFRTQSPVTGELSAGVLIWRQIAPGPCESVQREMVYRRRQNHILAGPERSRRPGSGRAAARRKRPRFEEDSWSTRQLNSTRRTRIRWSARPLPIVIRRRSTTSNHDSLKRRQPALCFDSQRFRFLSATE